MPTVALGERGALGESLFLHDRPKRTSREPAKPTSATPIRATDSALASRMVSDGRMLIRA